LIGSFLEGHHWHFGVASIPFRDFAQIIVALTDDVVVSTLDAQRMLEQGISAGCTRVLGEFE